MPEPTSKPPAPPGIAVGTVLPVAGLLAWLWLDDWRFAATGAALFVLALIVSAAVKNPLRRTPKETDRA